ncbi:hypothetical protein H257_19375 [Aphanomyces astaci]|uniref:Uncharacterized protein n=1 Tax=Aphanomyces astaci TaxID=112090 RepID=W4FAF9_APHAT|nr:hypothetical protein H257_19375 [Aphanomyces astaci]ETV63693.1 hypothetical protein H257_19375 [Aphanomyces astaci]|eukprot:XP_009846823.1 hypothetical protein H257_19375 [Aphanomyces astaci]
MKFLAALVHAAVAADAAASKVAFDNPPSITGLSHHGFRIASEITWAVRFRTQALSGAHDNAPGVRATSTLTLNSFNFTVEPLEFERVPSHPSMWFRPELCPSVNDLPHCTESIAFGFISISDPVDGAKYKYQWTPKPPIDVAFNTTYWFTVNSTRKTWAKSPVWVDGYKKFVSNNDPLGDVRLAFNRNDGDPWKLIPLRDGRSTPSLQVHATHSS